MDKIIDGVDVSGCMYYSKKQQIYSATKPLCKMKDCCMLSDSVSLCLEKDCYYKQLKRLQAENERLKHTLQGIKELARGLINGTIGGCEDDIGSMLEDIITKAEEE